jgi:hypothetical protein
LRKADGARQVAIEIAAIPGIPVCRGPRQEQGKMKIGREILMSLIEEYRVTSKTSELNGLEL